MWESAMAAVDDGDDDEVNPVAMILLCEEQDGDKSLSAINGEEGQGNLQLHFLSSVNSSVAIRQLPSLGLSFQLWPAAKTLLTLLDQLRCHPSNSPLTPMISDLSDGPISRPLNILEIGSGTGLVGIVAAVTLGAEVTVTDLPHVVSNLEFNVEANAEVLRSNGGSVQVMPLSWGNEEDGERIGREFDLIMASDVVYHDHLYEPLLKTLQWLLMGGGNEKMAFVMAHLRRWKKESVFFKKAKRLFKVEVLFVEQPPEGSRLGVVVYRFSARQSEIHDSPQTRQTPLLLKNHELLFLQAHSPDHPCQGRRR